MTPNQWLLFVGVPALFAILALVADWRRTARRHIDEFRRGDVSGSAVQHEPPDLPRSPSELKSQNPQSKAEEIDPLEELERVIRLTRRPVAKGAGEKPMDGPR